MFRIIALAGVLAMSAAVSGCTVQARPATYAVTSAPVAIESYPSDYYEGRQVYYYGDHWYYRDGGAWRYYHSEPTVLYQRRARPGPAYHAQPYNNGPRSAPPAYRPAPRSAPHAAPPAYRR